VEYIIDYRHVSKDTLAWNFNSLHDGGDTIYTKCLCVVCGRW